MQIINLAKERQKRRGVKPPITLIGINSTSACVLKTTLACVEPEDRGQLLIVLARGSYSSMIREIASRFEIADIAETQAKC